MVVLGHCLPTPPPKGPNGERAKSVSVTPAAAALIEKMRVEDDERAKRASKAESKAHLTAKKGGRSAKKKD